MTPPRSTVSGRGLRRTGTARPVPWRAASADATSGLPGPISTPPAGPADELAAVQPAASPAAPRAATVSPPRMKERRSILLIRNIHLRDEPAETASVRDRNMTPDPAQARQRAVSDTGRQPGRERPSRAGHPEEQRQRQARPPGRASSPENPAEAGQHGTRHEHDENSGSHAGDGRRDGEALTRLP